MIAVGDMGLVTARVLAIVTAGYVGMGSGVDVAKFAGGTLSAPSVVPGARLPVIPGSVNAKDAIS